MAINAYIGIPGSGKTYEVVNSVILPAYLSGRTIVTNIVGIKEENFLEYANRLKEKSRKDLNLDNLGKIISVDDDDVLKDNFFPFKGADVETIAKNGDLICIDEVWRIFDESKKIKDNHRSFLAEHRHFTNEKGFTSDLVVVSQSLANIPRFIKDRIETVYRMTKLKSLGLDKRYRIDVFAGTKLFKSNIVHSIQSKYNPEIFKLYKSYDGDNAKERAIDDRNSIFKSFAFKFKMVMALLFMVLGGFYLYSVVNKSMGKKDDLKIEQKEEKAPVQQQKTNTQVKELNSNGAKKLEKALSRKELLENLETLPLSDTWRITGVITKNGKKTVVLTNEKLLRYEDFKYFKGDGFFIVGVVDNAKVSYYSGVISSREKMPTFKIKGE